MDINSLKESKLKQFTGCDFKTIYTLEIKLSQMLAKKRGRPYSHPVRTMLIVALIKLRTDLDYRAMETILGIPYATLSRYTLAVCRLLAKALPKSIGEYKHLIVDCTGNRVRSRKQNDFSGHKHHMSRRVQAVVTDQGEIVDISKDYHGSAHDKTIWNKELGRIKRRMDRIVLSDKAYAGAKGENTLLLRPVKHNETAYKTEKEKTKAFNRELSKIRVKVEHVFAQLKHYRIISGIFPLKSTNYGVVVAALATIYNTKLHGKTVK